MQRLCGKPAGVAAVGSTDDDRAGGGGDEVVAEVEDEMQIREPSGARPQDSGVVIWVSCEDGRCGGILSQASQAAGEECGDDHEVACSP